LDASVGNLLDHRGSERQSARRKYRQLTLAYDGFEGGFCTLGASEESSSATTGLNRLSKSKVS
jgi:hypothetical protein